MVSHYFRILAKKDSVELCSRQAKRLRNFAYQFPFKLLKDVCGAPSGIGFSVGGSWIAVTQGKHWDDKPRWSRDGQTIYFVSGGSGFFNVWGIHFDPSKGKTVGEAFRVTAFDSVGRMIPNLINSVELELNQDKLLLTMEERSGSIWMLDKVDH